MRPQFYRVIVSLLSFRERKKQRNLFEIATHVMVFFAQAIDFSSFTHSAHMLKSKRAPSLPFAMAPAISTAFAQQRIKWNSQLKKPILRLIN